MKELFEIDELKVYFGEDFKINDHILIRQPTVGEILEAGELAYYGMVNALIAVPSDYIAQLHKLKIDWNEMTDFELFCLLVPSMAHETTRLLFGNLDFSHFTVVPVGPHQCYLHHEKDNFDLDEVGYMAIKNYLCHVHNMTPRRNKKAGNAMTKDIMIEDAIAELKKTGKKQQKSVLRSVISTLVNFEGFKYNLEEIRAMKLGAFYDSARRIPIIQSSRALLQGCYAGNIDTKKLDKNELNYMRDLT